MPGARNAKDPRYRFRRNAFSVRRFSDSFHCRSGFWHHHGDAFLRMFLSPFLNADRDPNSVLISDEAITRLNHFNLKRMPDAYERDEIENHFRLFARTARQLGYGRTKVLLIMRRQDLLLASSYAQLSRKIVGASQADFERRIYKLLQGASELDRRFYSFDYESLHECLVRSLSEENVKFIPLEEIASDFSNFVNSIAEFLDMQDTWESLSELPTNSRAKGENKWGLRPLLLFKSSQILKSPTIDFEFTVPRFLTRRGKQIKLTPRLSSDILHHYAASNGKLNDSLEFDLSRFGYC